MVFYVEFEFKTKENGITNRRSTYKAETYNKLCERLEGIYDINEVKRIINLTAMGYVPDDIQEEFEGAGFKERIKWEDVNEVWIKRFLDGIFLR